MAGGDVWRARIDELAIHLVGEEEEVVLLHKVAYLIHFTAGIKVAGRVVGVTNQDGTRTFVYQLLELLHFRQRESLFDGRCNRTYPGSGRDGKRHVIGISRFGHDNLVTRIEACHEREQHRFRTAGCNDYVIGCELDVVLIVIPHQLLAIAAVACTGTVLQYLTVNIADGVNRDLRRRQVGLSDIEVEYMDAPLLGCICQGSQLSDRRCGHLHSANRNCWHEFFISFYHLSRKCSDLFDTKGKQRHKNFKNLIYIKNTMLFKKNLVPLK